MQSRHAGTMDVMAELRSRQMKSPPPDMETSLDAGYSPNMIFASKGSSVKRKSSQNTSDTILNGNLSRRPGLLVTASVDSGVSSEVARSRSSSPPRSPVLVSTMSRSESASREGRKLSRASSASSSRSSVGRQRSAGADNKGGTASQPPLIPLPQSILERKASLSSSTSSLSSSKRSNQLPPASPPLPSPSPPPPPPIDIPESHRLSDLSLSAFPPPPDADEPSWLRETENHITSRSESTKSSKKRRAPDVPPVFNPPSPPPYPPPPSPPADIPTDLPLSKSSSANVESAPASSAQLLTPTTAEAKEDARKKSTSHSEVMGMLDDAIGDQYSASPLNQSASDAFSPAFYFPSTSDEPYTPGIEVTRTAESSELTLDLEEKVFSEPNETGPETNGVEGVGSSNDASSPNISPRSPDVRHIKSDSSDSSDNGLKIELNELPPTGRRLRRKRSKSPTKVSKLVPDIKTVRKQIKPGTVDELANLFTNMRDQPVTSPLRDSEVFDYDLPGTVERLENLEKANVQSTEIKRNVLRRSNTLNEEPFPKLRESVSDESLHEHVRLLQTQSVPLDTEVGPKLYSANSEDNILMSTSIPDPKSTPNFDYLSASKEIFKHVISSRNSSRGNSLRRDYTDEQTSSTDPESLKLALKKAIGNRAAITSLATGNDTADDRIEENEDETVAEASGLTSHVGDSEHTKNEETQAYVNIEEVHGLNTDDNTTLQGKHHLYIETSNRLDSDSDALLTSTAHHVTSESTSAPTLANISQNEEEENAFSKQFSSEIELKTEEEEKESKPSMGENGEGSTANQAYVQLSTQVVSGVEPDLTPGYMGEKEGYTNINNEHDSTGPEPVTENISSTVTETLLHTGVVRNEMSEVSIRSQFGSDLETLGKIRQDHELWESGSERSTSSSRHGSLSAWTNVDPTSKKEETMIDGTIKAEPLPDEFSNNVSVTAQDKNENQDHDVLLSKTEDQHDDKSSSSSSSSSDDETGVDSKERTLHADQEEINKSVEEGLSLTDVANVTTEGEEGLHKQTDELFRNGLFAHTSDEEISRETGEGTEEDKVDEDQEPKNVENEERVSRKSSTSSSSRESSPKRDVDPIREAFEAREEREEEVEVHTNGETTKSGSDEFLSILDDIQLKTDITSDFVGKSRLSNVYNSFDKGNQDDDKDDKDDSSSSSSDHDYVDVLPPEAEDLDQDKYKEEESFERSVTTKTYYTSTSSVDLNEEIQKQHEVLIPRLPDPEVDENNPSFTHNRSFSARGSVSSVQSSLKSDKQNNTKETTFDSEFFGDPEDNKETARDRSTSSSSSSSSSDSNVDRISLGKFQNLRRDSLDKTPSLKKQDSVTSDTNKAEHNEPATEAKVSYYSAATTVSESPPATPQEDNVAKGDENEDESHLFSKDKFRALRDIFVQREEDSKTERALSPQSNRNSFTFATSPSSPGKGISGSKYDEKREIGGQVSVGGFTSPVNVEARSTRDDFGGEYQPPNSDTGIVGGLQRDTDHIDSSSTSASGSDGETQSGKLRRKKSKQKRYSYDLPSGEFKRSSVSQKSSIRSVSSKGSITRAGLDDVFVRPDTEPESDNSADTVIVKDDSRKSSVKSGAGSVKGELINGFGHSRERSSSSESDRSETKRNRSSKQSSRKSSVKSASPRGSIHDVPTASSAFVTPEGESSVALDLPVAKEEDDSFFHLGSPRLDSSETSQSPREPEAVDTDIFLPPLDVINTVEPYYPSSSAERKLSRQDSHVESEKGSDKSSDKSKSPRSSPRRQSSEAKSSSSSSESDDSLVEHKELFRQNSKHSSDKGSVRSRSSKGSSKRSERNSVHDEKKDTSSSSDSDDSSTKLKRQSSSLKSEPQDTHSHVEESKEDEKMTAIVGEVTSFGIHRMTTEEESFTMTSDNSSSPVSPRNSIATRQEPNGSDIYLIQDHKGDYYALQEVKGDENNTGSVQNNVTAHVMDSSRDGENYRQFNGHSSHDTTLSNIDLYSDSKGERTNLYVDSSAVEDDKAREVISAFLDSQEESSKRRQTSSMYSEDSFNQNTTIKQNYSQDYNRAASGGSGQWYHPTPADNNTMRTVTVNNTGLENASSSSFQSSPNRGTVVVQQGYNGVTGDTSFLTDGYQSPGNYYNGLVTHHNNVLPRNSTLSVNTELNSRTDSSQVWQVPGYEPYTTGSGAEDKHSSSLLVTNANTPQQQVYMTRSNTPRVEDSYYDTPAVNGYAPTSSVTQPLSVNVNHGQDRSNVSPFKTTPISITTTTQAVVGEKVDMRINFSPTQELQRQGTTETTSTSSDDESQPRRYVVRNAPQKSSLKKTSKYDSSSVNDSASDIVYNKKETVTANINLGGKDREIILKPYEYHNTQAPRPVSVSDSLSPDSVDGPLYRVYHGSAPRTSRSLSPETTRNYSQDSDYYRREVYEKSPNVSRDYPDGNLYRVRNFSTSVPDGLNHTDSHRGRQKSKSPNVTTESEKSYRIVRGAKQHHSPERFFTNPKLSLRRDDYDTQGLSSDEETSPKRYRTVTKVYLDGDKPRSRSQSPGQRYKVSSLQSQPSFDKKRSESVKDDGKYYEVINVKSSKNKRAGSPASSESESEFKSQQQRYRVIGTSDSTLDRRGARAHSSPKLSKKRERSFEEATITRTENVKPSKSLPQSSKTHKTVIQLEVDGKHIKENGRSSEDIVDPRYKVKELKSADDAKTTIIVNNQNETEGTKMYRTGRARSTERNRRGSSSDSGDSDIERNGVYDLSPRLVKTSQQKAGNKMYVVNSTVSDPVDRDNEGNYFHPPGWYKSTIDINEENPNRIERNNNYVVYNKPNNLFSPTHSMSEEKLDSQRYRTEKTVYFVREAPRTQPDNVSKYPYRSHSSEFIVSPDSGQGTEIASSDGETENIRQQKFERVERIYEVRTEPHLPEQFESVEDLSNDLRVLRGKILIKNRLDGSEHDEDEFDENVNVFDNSFHMGKDNPLYSSDPDIMASLQREEEEMSKHVTQDITFETVDRIAHKYKDDRQISPRPQRKQNLSALLLSKLANVDSKDIRQTIDVEHHNEEIYGDIDFIHADGERKPSKHTSNFDSVNEKVELTLTQGKAYVIIKVIAERIVPTDYEFNVWRKSQAIVTRQIEIDLLANEQRRRLYQHVMESAGPSGYIEDGRSRSRRRGSYTDTEALSPQEKQLSSMETLKLFSQILDVTDGQGDKDHTQMQTKQEMGQLPASASDLLY